MVDQEQRPEANHWAAFGIKHVKKRAFLSLYARCGGVTRAADGAHISRSQHTIWLREDEDYARAFADAQDRYVEKLEAEADRRAVDGVDKPLTYQGEIFGHTREYSDNLMMFRLKALNPEKYRERQDMTIGGNGKQLRIVIDGDAGG